MYKRKTIKVKAKKSKTKGFNYDYTFFGSHGQIRTENKPKRYLRVIGFISGHNHLREA